MVSIYEAAAASFNECMKHMEGSNRQEICAVQVFSELRQAADDIWNMYML